ncbi:TetR/AcrR family transcriptional regulator [Spirosoma oryzicola]|uniref:TetR/AcrR family transcriptional regulator n=1 Tax=Spirosoma oryzicola TaxID=2898794 RepID=UPI001E592026|nr:TetR/AcrR family transcriptional regulator [Spirosoma oryzicola]UHG94462.1 TetR/AcrR family transcriptional regulator [Spirosoma oryzicola]
MSKAALTRFTILQKALELIYRNGYQATSIDDIIATTQLTKGALFYHFKNKEEMGLAIINEILAPNLLPYMKDTLSRTTDIRLNLYSMMENLLLTNTFFNVDYGCPAVNLIEEMAPVNPQFKQALLRIMQQWHSAIEAAIVHAQDENQLNSKHNPAYLATYIISNYSGIRNTGKVMGQTAYTAFLSEYQKFLLQLD